LNGVLNIYKEKGYTSHDVVAVVRKLLHIKKVGHTGTLDPQAEGVLPICVGKATKIASHITDQTKAYRAIVKLGITTTTQDATGETIEQKPVHYDQMEIEKVVESFIGHIQQIPPMYSAIKINGKKLYELARKGETIERSPRDVQIHDINIRQWLPPDEIEMDVVCSKGTYIRTLCEDIGIKLGYGAHMKNLIRTKSGMFQIEHSITLEQLKQLIDRNMLQEAMIPIDKIFMDYKIVNVKENATGALMNGNRIYLPGIQKKSDSLEPNDIVKTYDFEGNFIGLHTVVAGEDKLFLKPLKLFI
jgi:tRNA pseudouridine55 synthase